MLTYAAGAGHTFFDRRLYLPAGWAGDAGHRRGAGVPEEITFATKPGLGIAILRGAIERDLSFAWVAADADYGRDPALRAFLYERALTYVLGVPVTLPVAARPASRITVPWHRPATCCTTRSSVASGSVRLTVPTLAGVLAANRPRRPPRARLPTAAAPLASPRSAPGNRRPLQPVRKI